MFAFLIFMYFFSILWCFYQAYKHDFLQKMVGVTYDEPDIMGDDDCRDDISEVFIWLSVRCLIPISNVLFVLDLADFLSSEDD